jgi:hypothetical protein
MLVIVCSQAAAVIWVLSPWGLCCFVLWIDLIRWSCCGRIGWGCWPLGTFAVFLVPVGTLSLTEFAILQMLTQALRLGVPKLSGLWFFMSLNFLVSELACLQGVSDMWTLPAKARWFVSETYHRKLGKIINSLPPLPLTFQLAASQSLSAVRCLQMLQQRLLLVF